MTAIKQNTDWDALAKAWCAMWNDDPAIARDLVTDDFRVWFGISGEYARRGPRALEDFVTRYREEGAAAKFTPRVVAGDDGGTRFAYSWDARLPDGTVVTGADTYTLRDGRISENWSISQDRRTTLEPRPASAAVSAADLTAACQAWSPMWNGQPGLAAGLVTDDFRIWFAARESADDNLAGPDGLARYVTRHRAGRPGLAFGKHRDLIIDTGRQRAAFTWTAAAGERCVGGIDLFQLDAGRIDRAWSWTGRHAFTF